MSETAFTQERNSGHLSRRRLLINTGKLAGGLLLAGALPKPVEASGYTLIPKPASERAPGNGVQSFPWLAVFRNSADGPGGIWWRTDGLLDKLDILEAYLSILKGVQPRVYRKPLSALMQETEDKARAEGQSQISTGFCGDAAVAAKFTRRITDTVNVGLNFHPYDRSPNYVLSFDYQEQKATATLAFSGYKPTDISVEQAYSYQQQKYCVLANTGSAGDQWWMLVDSFSGNQVNLIKYQLLSEYNQDRITRAKPVSAIERFRVIDLTQPDSDRPYNHLIIPQDVAKIALGYATISA